MNTEPVIVLVEDDSSVARMLETYLGREGWAVRLAPTIAVAREIMRSPWDLALIDRTLPDGNGIELCRDARLAAPHNYIMILTGEGSDAAKVEGFDSGADDYVTKPFHMRELLARIRAGLRIVELQKELIQRSATDGLTGLQNRRSFDEKLTEHFAHALRYSRPLSVAIIDVDHFKKVNDGHGHQVGDAALQQIARILERDSRRTDVVARFGGEEFAVILPEASLLEAIRFAEKVRAAVAATNTLTVSVGVATFPYSPVHSPEELIYAADQALYRAKANGRNRVESENRRERFAHSPSFGSTTAAAVNSAEAAL